MLGLRLSRPLLRSAYDSVRRSISRLLHGSGDDGPWASVIGLSRLATVMYGDHAMEERNAPSVFKAAGLLLCDDVDGVPSILVAFEKRSKGSQLCHNPLGGKRETCDDDALVTACREFQEETGNLLWPGVDCRTAALRLRSLVTTAGVRCAYHPPSKYAIFVASCRDMPEEERARILQLPAKFAEMRHLELALSPQPNEVHSVAVALPVGSTISSTENVCTVAEQVPTQLPWERPYNINGNVGDPPTPPSTVGSDLTIVRALESEKCAVPVSVSDCFTGVHLTVTCADGVVDPWCLPTNASDCGVHSVGAVDSRFDGAPSIGSTVDAVPLLSANSVLPASAESETYLSNVDVEGQQNGEEGGHAQHTDPDDSRNEPNQSCGEIATNTHCHGADACPAATEEVSKTTQTPTKMRPVRNRTGVEHKSPAHRVCVAAKLEWIPLPTLLHHSDIAKSLLLDTPSFRPSYLMRSVAYTLASDGDLRNYLQDACGVSVISFRQLNGSPLRPLRGDSENLASHSPSPSTPPVSAVSSADASATAKEKYKTRRKCRRSNRKSGLAGDGSQAENLPAGVVLDSAPVQGLSDVDETSAGVASMNINVAA
eukprot:Opistho-2@2426